MFSQSTFSGKIEISHVYVGVLRAPSRQRIVVEKHPHPTPLHADIFHMLVSLLLDRLQRP